MAAALVLRQTGDAMEFSEMLNIALMQGFAGLSLFSVLLLMGLGLAIIFGQMGVINMAHGEFMTIGAYTVFLFSTLTEKFAPGFMPYYFPLSIGVAFILAFIAGWLVEWGPDPLSLQAPAGHAAGHLGPEPGHPAGVPFSHRPQGSQPCAARMAHGLLGSGPGLDIPINGLFVLGLTLLVTCGV